MRGNVYIKGGDFQGTPVFEGIETHERQARIEKARQRERLAEPYMVDRSKRLAIRDSHPVIGFEVPAKPNLRLSPIHGCENKETLHMDVFGGSERSVRFAVLGMSYCKLFREETRTRAYRTVYKRPTWEVNALVVDAREEPRSDSVFALQAEFAAETGGLAGSGRLTERDYPVEAVQDAFTHNESYMGYTAIGYLITSGHHRTIMHDRVATP